jgi:hypothetical protein
MTRLVFIGALSAIACSSSSSRVGDPNELDAGPRCDLGAVLAGLAGPASMDCGFVAFRASSQAADSCAVSAFTKKTPFHVSYDLMGTDSHLMRGLAQDASGRVWQLDYDGNPSGSGGDTNPIIVRQTCDSPAINSLPGERILGVMPISCGELGPAEKVCP